MPDPGTATGTLANPYPGAPITSDFGPRVAPIAGASTFHSGLDYGVGIGTPTHAMDGGRVIFAGSAGSAGNVVVVDHGNGAYSRYLHLDSIGVQVGDLVERNEVIAESGATGIGTGPHGHVELRVGGTGDFRGGPGSTARAIDFESLVGRDYTDVIVLQRGDTGSGVTRMQEQLVAAGFGAQLGASGADGDYGSGTVAAVEAFQRAAGYTGTDVDGKFGPATQASLDTAVRQGAPAPAEPTPVPAPSPAPSPAEPAPQPSAGGGALDTPGAFAATSSSDILSTRQGEGEVALSGLSLEETRLVARSVFGDNVSVDLLSAIGASHGDEQTFLERTITLARHEGAFSFGRENADPAAGFNVGTFQEGGGSVVSQAESNTQFAGRVEDGTAIAQRELGRELTAAELANPAVRDVLAFVGWRETRSEGILPDLQDFARANPGSYTAERMAPFTGTDFTGDPGQLFSLIADPTLNREQVIEGMSYLTQGGIRDIGESVYDWTTPGGAELYVDMDVVNARAAEPDALRAEPAFPTLSSGDAGPAVSDLQSALVDLGYTLGTTGPAGDGVDGSFGAGTRAAVVAEQQKAGLGDDGVVGAGTWAHLAAAVSQEVALEGSTPGDAPAPVIDGPAAEPPVVTDTPAREPLGDAAPEEYSVRQFTDTIGVGAWNEAAAQSTMTGDDARWVADTESPGDAQVQLTFGGAVDPAASSLVARPGSAVEAVLAEMAATGDGAQIRTSVQNGSTGTYVLVDEAAILNHFESLDAFDAAARQDLAIQAAAPDPREVLAGNPGAANYLESLADITGTLVASNVDPAGYRPGEDLSPQAMLTTDALFALARSGEPLTPEAMQAAVRGVAPEATPFDAAETNVLEDILTDVRAQAEAFPEVSEAFAEVRAEQTPSALSQDAAAPSLGQERVPLNSAPQASPSENLNATGGDGQTVPSGRDQAAEPSLLLP